MEKARKTERSIRYHLNESVMYGAAGVCRITEISEQRFGGSRANYYVLKPVYNTTSTIYIPVENQSLTAKMRRVLSAEEIYELIEAMPNEQPIWIDQDTLRREAYLEILKSGDREKLVRLIKTLHLRQQTQAEKGRKLHAADDRILKDAEKILHEEFAHVLHIKREEVLPLILRQIQVEATQ